MTSLYNIAKKFATFIGPGIMISVAYMDPGNYSTSVSAGANYQYKLLFTVFISNIFAVILQVLCIKLGSVTGLDLAENCKVHLPKWLNIILYIHAELAIVATDLAEVVGTAITLEILFGIDIVYGVLITILDVLVILLFYKPESNSMRNVRAFEFFVGLFVLATCVCFGIELCKIDVQDPWEIARGYLPSTALLEEKGLYLSLGILGATVMPHSLYLGSSIVQSRIKDFDLKHEFKSTESSSSKPSIHALRHCLNYSYAELIISLFLVATFVNSSILIVSGATLYGRPDADDADLLSIYEMLSKYISPAAGLVFALAMLFSGQSAGIVCTMAGQIVSEGFITWSISPWARRLITRMLAIIPCFIVTLLLGRKGIADILNLSQVILSLILPFVSAPLIYFTSSSKFMTVEVDSLSEETTSGQSSGLARDETHPLIPSKKTCKAEDFRNGSILTTVSVLVWGTIAFFNVYLVASWLFGKVDHL
ncbi:hypothetical protein WICPIJ_000494 [Wickerhamomyces pijperi]|uniref:Uncharacterized protein n=1 Tax=Wickerhamomyces pijperi TaxID=599730 RepID=A0A9P8TRY5_WICPI|nr:hypothetical protein WICPIJ_000494 [Wickerhamomyces pijperi]